jgi:hypothetical protein
LHSTGKLSLPLPDDNPDALNILPDIIHIRNRQVPQEVTLSISTHLTILVDKYQMSEVLWFFLKSWLADPKLKASLPTTYPSPNMVPWLATSWVFKLPTEFKNVTRLALQQTDGKIADCLFEGLDLPIPSIIIGMQFQLSSFGCSTLT